ncbi:hypothetical protein ACVWZA_001483 [Sphingomonas sp. UYAg733]
MPESGHGLAGSREFLLWLLAAAAAVVAMWLLSPGERGEPAAAKGGVTVVTTRPEPSQTRAVPVKVAVVQSPIPIPVAVSVPVAPVPAAAAVEERLELPLDLAAIESEGSTEPPLGEHGAALGQP